MAWSKFLVASPGCAADTWATAPPLKAMVLIVSMVSRAPKSLAPPDPKLLEGREPRPLVCLLTSARVSGIAERAAALIAPAHASTGAAQLVRGA